MSRLVGTLLAAAALLLGAAGTAQAAPVVTLTRLSGDVSGVLAAPQAGVTVTVALQRNHRDAAGRLTDRRIVGVAGTRTDASGAWSVRLPRAWGDPRDEIVVHADNGAADIDLAALRADGGRELGLVPSSVLWAADGASVTVDCGDSDAGAEGTCQSVAAIVAGRTGPLTGVRDGTSPRRWRVALGAPVGVDDQVSVAEERTVADTAGQPVRLVLARDIGIPRGGDESVQRVAGVAPYCAVDLGTAHLRCYGLRGGYAYETTSGVALAYQPSSTTFEADLPSVEPGQQIAVRRAGGPGRALTVLRVANRRGAGCDAGAWLGTGVPQDLRSTQICPADGVMAGADRAPAQFDELSGGWTEGAAAGAPVPPGSLVFTPEGSQFVVGSPAQGSNQAATTSQPAVTGGLSTLLGPSEVVLGDGIPAAASLSPATPAAPEPAADTATPSPFADCDETTCVVTLRAARLHGVLRLRRAAGELSGTGVFGARIGGRTLRGVGRVVQGDDGALRLLTADGTTLRIDKTGAYVLSRTGRPVTGKASLAVRVNGADDAYARSLANKVVTAVRRTRRARVGIDGPTEEKVSVVFHRRGARTVTRSSVAGPGVHRILRVRRPAGTTSVTVTVTDALGNITRVSRRL